MPQPFLAKNVLHCQGDDGGVERPLKDHDLDLSNPKNRLARARVAQTILVALLVTVANDHFLDQWRHTHQPQTSSQMVSACGGGCMSRTRRSFGR